MEQQKSAFFEVLDYKCGVRSRNSGGYPGKRKKELVKDRQGKAVLDMRTRK